jgi:Tissue inhibitor of metalloproteinase.
VIGRDKEFTDHSTKDAVMSHFIKYDILVTRAYMGLKRLSEIIPNTDYFVFKASIYSQPSNSLSCGMRLDPRDRLILSGNIRNRKLTIGFCDLKKQWSENNDFLMKQVFGKTTRFEEEGEDKTIKDHP